MFRIQNIVRGALLAGALALASLPGVASAHGGCHVVRCYPYGCYSYACYQPYYYQRVVYTTPLVVTSNQPYVVRTAPLKVIIVK
jgi:hypothetical protein